MLSFSNSASRILSLIFITLLVNKQGWPGLLILSAPLAILFYCYPEQGKKSAILARRLRWFFLSIVILYMWFLPGQMALPALGKYSPSIEGIIEAGLRIVSLLIIVLYSNFLLLLTQRNDLISGIDFLISPLKVVGVDSQRFALRLALVLGYVPEVVAGFSQVKKPVKSTVLLDKAAEMINSMNTLSNKALEETIEIKPVSRPNLVDTLIPLTLFIWLIWK